MRISSTPVWNTKCAMSLKPMLAARMFRTTNQSSRRSLLSEAGRDFWTVIGSDAVSAMRALVLLEQTMGIVTQPCESVRTGPLFGQTRYPRVCGPDRNIRKLRPACADHDCANRCGEG